MDELTSERIDALGARLRDLRVEIEERLAGTRDAVRPVSLDEPIGRLTRMDAIQQQSMTAAGRRASDIRLQQVVQALTAIGNGTYGQCRRCRDPISFRRLEARPESPYCLACQAEIDRKHA